MVARVAQLCPSAVLMKLDKLIEPMKMTVTTKVKANAVKQVNVGSKNHFSINYL